MTLLSNKIYDVSVRDMIYILICNKKNIKNFEVSVKCEENECKEEKNSIINKVKYALSKLLLLC